MEIDPYPIKCVVSGLFIDEYASTFGEIIDPNDDYLDVSLIASNNFGISFIKNDNWKKDGYNFKFSVDSLSGSFASYIKAVYSNSATEEVVKYFDIFFIKD